MPTLLEISDEMQSLDALISEMAESGGDITEVAETIDKWFSEIGNQKNQKIESFASLIRECELRAAARKEESERLAKRVKIDQSTAEFLRSKLKSFFEQHNIKKIDTDRYCVSIGKNGGSLPIEYSEPVERAPQEFQKRKTETSYDGDKVREALAAGRELAFAKFGERGTRINIK